MPEQLPLEQTVLTALEKTPGELLSASQVALSIFPIPVSDDADADMARHRGNAVRAANTLDDLVERGAVVFDYRLDGREGYMLPVADRPEPPAAAIEFDKVTWDRHGALSIARGPSGAEVGAIYRWSGDYAQPFTWSRRGRAAGDRREIERINAALAGAENFTQARKIVATAL